MSTTNPVPNVTDDLLGDGELTPAQLDAISKPPPADGEQDFSALTGGPHWMFDTATIFERMRPLALCIRDKQEIISKVVYLRQVGHMIRMSANTGEVTVAVDIPVLNNTNVLAKGFVVEFKAFLAVVKNSGAKFLVREANGNLLVSVLGGEIELESYNLDVKTFEMAEFEAADKTKAKKLEGVVFQQFLHRAAQSMALATRPEDKRVRVEKGTATSNFLSVVVQHQNVATTDMSFRNLDLVFLRILLEGKPEVHCMEFPKQNALFGTDFSVMIPKVDTADIAMISDAVSKIVGTMKFSIGPDHTYKVVSMIRSMVGNSGRVRFVGEKNKITITTKTKTGRDINFPIGQMEGDGKFDISCSIGTLVSATVLLRKEPLIACEVDDSSRMVMTSENLRILFGSLT